MSNPSKDKGTRGETSVVRYLNAHGLPSGRKALAGSDDQGDLFVMLGAGGEEVTLEVKAGKQTTNPSRSLMSKWKDETLREGRNSGHRCALVVVRYNRPLKNAEVWMPNSQWGGVDGWTMMHIDEFADLKWGG